MLGEMRVWLDSLNAEIDQAYEDRKRWCDEIEFAEGDAYAIAQAEAEVDRIDERLEELWTQLRSAQDEYESVLRMEKD